MTVRRHVVCAFPYCTNVFQMKHKLHRFCSALCQRQATNARLRKTPFERECRRPECRQLFRPYNMQVYCSNSCRVTHNYQTKREELIAYQRKNYQANRKRILQQKADYDRKNRGRKAAWRRGKRRKAA